jgi:hypothetical protein
MKPVEGSKGQEKKKNRGMGYQDEIEKFPFLLQRKEKVF